MQRISLAIVAAVLASRVASADKGGVGWECSTANRIDVCPAELSVPEGCPIQLVVPSGTQVVVLGTVRVARGRGPYVSVVRHGNTFWEYRPKGSELSLAARATVVATVDEPTHYMDFYANCDWVDGKSSFDRVAITVPDARAGDSVIAWGDVHGTDGIKITARAKCPAVKWPRFVSHAGACDKMPVVPARAP